MQASPLPPNPYLVAILLVAQSKAGPRFVFHYPPRPSKYQGSAKRQSTSYTAHGTNTSPSNDSESSSSDETAWNSDDAGEHTENDVIGSRTSGSKRHDNVAVVSSTGRRLKTTRGGTINDDEELFTESSDNDSRSGVTGKGGPSVYGTGFYEWEKVLGFSTDGLQKLLSPPKAYHKRKFEVCLDGFVFLGCPMFVREDGSWKKDKRRKQQSEHQSDAVSLDPQAREEAAAEGKTDNFADGVESDDLKRMESSQELPGDAAKANQERLKKTAGSLHPSDAAVETPGAINMPGKAKKSKLTMFHVVFIMNPPPLEYKMRIDDMYVNTVRQFAKILKLEQAHSFYVWSQSKIILKLKQKAKEEGTQIMALWNEIKATSSLAYSMATVFDAISASKIAHIKLTSSALEVPIQIPQPTHTSQVSTPMEPQLPGLWLTTANVIETETHGALNPHIGLLLLKDPEEILKEIAREMQDMSAPLTYFVRNLIPTKSLKKLVNIMNLSLQDIQALCNLLITGRQARAIPPLHPRDTYIVSPNADMRQLAAATQAFSQRFPTLPSLPEMLRSLSGTPKVYGMLMPSKEHRTAYMEMLAWLMRGGWVTQLRTFGWVKLASDIQYQACLKMLRAQAERAAAAAREAREAERKPQDTRLQIAGSGDAASRPPTRDSTSSPNPHVRRNDDPSTKNLSFSGTPPRQGSPVHRPVSPTTSPTITPDFLSPKYTVSKPPSRPASAAGSISSVRTAVHAPTNTDSPSTHAAPTTPEQSIHSSIPPSFNTSVHASTDPQHYLETWPTPTISDLPPIVAYEAQDAATKQFFEACLTLLGETLSKDDEEMGKLWPRLVKYFSGAVALEEISVREGLKRARVQGVLARLREENVLLVVRHW
ncbi:MAG: Nitrogen permease regulator 3 [Bogoriella megaspora]|nr:MAG: Nitrogen permease regulator 3 [Bogoriella megaspora]